jgi:anti-sigma factor RsiW
MNCHDVHDLLNPYSDGELDLIRHVEIEEHLAECSECAEQEKSLRSLRTALAASSLYHRAPAGLRERIQSAAPVAPPRPRPRSWMPFASAAAILFLVGVSATLTVLVLRKGPSADERLAEWVVAGHIRSLQVNHLTDVTSTDRHTVKPWFRGKLDFSPPVPDLSGPGFDLSGGRLDYVRDRQVVALVYYCRAHAINLFIWPADSEDEKPVWRHSRQGYHVRRWQRSGMTCWAVSDLNDEDLDRFVQGFQQQAALSCP